jgi:hypothetical protein
MKNKLSVMTLDGRKVYLPSAATIRQPLEIILEKIKLRTG